MANQRKSTWFDNELVELLGQDGNLVMHSRNLRETSTFNDEFRSFQEPQQCELSLASSANLIGGDEVESYIQYPLDDSLEKDFTSEFFSEMASIDMNNERHVIMDKTMPSPSLHQFSRSGFVSVRAKPSEERSGRGSKFGSSTSGSNRIPVEAGLSSEAVGFPGGEEQDGGIWLSPLSSQEQLTKIATASGENNQKRKRKRRGMGESEYPSEAECECEPGETRKPAQRSASTHRSRAAGVHNLSERKRRDRINEKFKTLQQLMPHCSKTDKATTLDEAIEYMKSLQFQVQMMWLRSGIPQLMFPVVQQYMPGVAIGAAYVSVPIMHNAVHVPTLAGASCSSLALHAVNLQNPMPSFHLQESYAPYHSPISTSSQVMNQDGPLSHILHQNQTTAAPKNNILPCRGHSPCPNVNSKLGKIELFD